MHSLLVVWFLIVAADVVYVRMPIRRCRPGRSKSVFTNDDHIDCREVACSTALGPTHGLEPLFTVSTIRSTRPRPSLRSFPLTDAAATAPIMDFSGLDRPIGMGGHFMNVFKDDELLTWRLVPFILIWVAFVVVLLVRNETIHYERVGRILTSHSVGLAVHIPLRARPAETPPFREKIYDIRQDRRCDRP